MRATSRWGILLGVVGLAWACGGGDGGADAAGSLDAERDNAATELRADAPAEDDVPGLLPLCACPQVPAGGTCRSCSTLDNHCETRDGQPWAVRCTIAKGCVDEENCSDLGAGATCVDGACTPATVAEPGLEVVETVEPDVVEVVQPGSKQVGQSCAESVDCANGMTCLSGQYTQAHCNPMCTTTQDCLDAAPGASGQCQAIGGYQVCVWMCGAYGDNATCPGDLDCDGAFCG